MEPEKTMKRANEVTYKGHVLTATTVSDHDKYAVTLAVRAPSGVQRSTGLLGKFPSAVGAVRYALAYGMASIDCRHAPAYD